MATCDVRPPLTVQKPRTRVRSKAAVSDGDRSCATTIASSGYARSAAGHSRDQPEHPPADVAKIRRALGEHLVLRAGQPIGQPREGAVPGGGCRRSAGDQLPRELDEIGIVEQLEVRAEDPGLHGTSAARGQRGELLARLRQRAIELAPLFFGRAGRVNRRHLLWRDGDDPSARDAGRRADAAQQPRAVGPPGAVRFGRRAVGLRIGGVEASLHQGDQRVERGTRIGPRGREHDAIAAADLQSHDGGDAARVRLVHAAMQPDVRVEAARGARQDCGRARVQPGGIADADLVRRHSLAGRCIRRTGGGAMAVEDHLEDGVAPRFDVAVALHQPLDAIRRGDDHLGQQAGRVHRDVIGLEFDQGLSGADRIAAASQR
jgi:hypothetical protein